MLLYPVLNLLLFEAVEFIQHLGSFNGVVLSFKRALHQLVESEYDDERDDVDGK